MMLVSSQAALVWSLFLVAVTQTSGAVNAPRSILDVTSMTNPCRYRASGSLNRLSFVRGGGWSSASNKEQDVEVIYEYEEIEYIEEEEDGNATLTDSAIAAAQVEAALKGVDQDGNPTIQLVSEISAAMKSVLLNDLNYQATDMKVLRPEIASVLVTTRVHRPTEGLPAHWLKDDAPKQGAALKKTVIRIGIVAAVCVAQIMLNGDKDDASSPKLEIGALWTSLVDKLFRKTTTDQGTLGLEVEEEPHDSVRPGEKPMYNPDEAWLDRRITDMAKAIDDFIDFLFKKR